MVCNSANNDSLTDNDNAMHWIVVETEDVEQDLERFVSYLLFEKMSEQAAKAVLDDYDETLDELGTVAGILKIVDNPILADLGYRKIRFRRHDYYLMYRIEGQTAIVDRMYHDLQDPNGTLK